MNLILRATRRLLGATLAHHFADRVLNLPNPWFASPYTNTHPNEGVIVDNLKTDGVAVVPHFVAPELVLAMRLHFCRATMKYRDSGHLYTSGQPLLISWAAAELAASPLLLHVAGAYFQRGPFLSNADYRRVLPLDMAAHESESKDFAKGYSSSHWHHDTVGRQIKAMIYLTDVGPGDQNFACIPGTHRGWKSCGYEKSRFTDAQVLSLECMPREVYGKAGDLVLFDSNIIHRLRRTLGAERESITFYYHPGRMLSSDPIALHPDTAPVHRRTLSAMSVNP